ncbi:MAG: hypothetical protein APR53_07055 [Methanoculleus sp. SDB]|nr:MAG: hypothetical protein APR53_07055 [Methanoculleus sp. SDB]
MLDELRLIVLNERESGRLSQIRHEAFSGAHKYVEQLYQEVQRETPSLDRFLAGRPRDAVSELHSMAETLEEIVTLRCRKILTLALYGTENSDELKKMLPPERVLFDDVVHAIHQCRDSLIGSFPAATEEAADEEEEGADETVPESRPAAETRESGDADAPAGEWGYSIVRILEDVEPFMGEDGRVYNLMKEDIVTLPESNAQVLCGRDIALNIRLSK